MAYEVLRNCAVILDLSRSTKEEIQAEDIVLCIFATGEYFCYPDTINALWNLLKEITV